MLKYTIWDQEAESPWVASVVADKASHVNNLARSFAAYMAVRDLAKLVNIRKRCTCRRRHAGRLGLFTPSRVLPLGRTGVVRHPARVSNHDTAAYADCQDEDKVVLSFTSTFEIGVRGIIQDER